MDYLSSSGCVHSLNFHFVFVTKYRKRQFNRSMLNSSFNVLQNLSKQLNFKLCELNGEEDHIHILVQLPPTIPPSYFAFRAKGLLSHTFGINLKFSPSYFCCTTGGAPLEIIKQYIQNQKPI